LITERGEKERRRFATYASESEQNPGDDTSGRGFHHDVDDRFPSADAESERGFAVSIWDEQDDFFCRAQDQRNHDETKSETTSVCREAFKTQDNQTIHNNAPGN